MTQTPVKFDSLEDKTYQFKFYTNDHRGVSGLCSKEVLGEYVETYKYVEIYVGMNQYVQVIK